MEALFAIRLGFVGLISCAGVFVVWRHERVLSTLKTFFWQPVSPLNLGLLRAVIFGLVFQAALESAAPWFASLPESFRNLPRGWVWLEPLFPITPRFAVQLQRVLLVSSFCAAVGFLTRPASVVASLTAILVLGIENFYLKINHGHHVPVLSALVLATSPAGEAFSVDALVRRARAQPPARSDRAYTIPVRFCWLLLGTMYLFPGLWKLWETGDLWFDGTKIRLELFDKWAQMPDYFPPARVDKMPFVPAVLGTTTVLFEVGFFFALFHRTSRMAAGLFAAAFHIGIGLTMNIWFFFIHPLIVLIDFPWILPQRARLAVSALLARMPQAAAGRQSELLLAELGQARSAKPYSLAASVVVGSTLVCGMVVAGLGPVDSWPIAVYPRFATRATEAPATAVGLRFSSQSPDGRERPLRVSMAPLGDAEVVRLVRAALKHQRRHGEFPEEHLALLTRIVRDNAGPFPPGERLLIYHYGFPVDPDLRRGVTPELELIAEADF